MHLHIFGHLVDGKLKIVKVTENNIWIKVTNKKKKHGVILKSIRVVNNLKLKTMFKNPFSFEGRIRRTEYGLSVIIYAVFDTIISRLGSETGGGLF